MAYYFQKHLNEVLLQIKSDKEEQQGAKPSRKRSSPVHGHFFQRSKSSQSLQPSLINGGCPMLSTTFHPQKKTTTTTTSRFI